MRYLYINFLGCFLLFFSCGKSEEQDQKGTNSKGKPKDNYACSINSDGYCIFTGIPHKTGLKENSHDIIDREGNFLFSMDEAAAVNSSGEILKAKGTPASNGDELIKASQKEMYEDEKAFHKVIIPKYILF